MVYCRVKPLRIQRFNRRELNVLFFFGGLFILFRISDFITDFMTNFTDTWISQKDKVELATQLANETAIVRRQFKPIISHDDICRKNVKNLQFIIIVYSKPQNRARRRTVRRTWGEQSLLNRLGAVLLFALALPKLTSEQKAVLRENSVYHDIIQFGFLDSAGNKTYKTIASIGWVSQRCANAKMLMKIEDDVRIKTSFMVSVLGDIANKSNGDKLFCVHRWGEGPLRDRRSKWYIPVDLYPFPLYPDFCAGPVYMIPVALTAEFYMEAVKTKFFKLEDVFLTGIVRHNLRRQIEALNNMYCDCIIFDENRCLFCHE